MHSYIVASFQSYQFGLLYISFTNDIHILISMFFLIEKSKYFFVLSIVFLIFSRMLYDEPVIDSNIVIAFENMEYAILLYLFCKFTNITREINKSS